MTKLVYLLSILIFISCSTKESTYEEMKSDKLLSESFTDIELQNLAIVLDFFDEIIFDETKEVNIEKSYNKYLERDSIKIIEKGQLRKIKYKNLNKVFSILDSTFVNSFWDIGIITNINPETKKQTKTEYLHLKVYNSSGLSKYANFIEKYSKENKLLTDYIKNAKVSNEFFGPGDQGMFIIHFRDFNKKDIKVRLIYSLNNIIINERNK